MSVSRRTMLGWTGCGTLSLVVGGYALTPASARSYPRKIPFQDTDVFDDALTKSMREGFEAIDIELPATNAKSMPPRLRAWLEQVVDTDGEIRFRDVTPKGRGLPLVILMELIVAVVGPYIAEAIDDALHKPASDYHAVVVGQGVDANEATLLGVELYRRGSSSWAEALDTSVPMRLA